MKINEQSLQWLTGVLRNSANLRNFTRFLGGDPDDPEKVMKLFEQGLSGDPKLHNAALTHLSTRPPISYRQVEADLLERYGVDIIFAIALLSSTGREDQSEEKKETCPRGQLELKRDDERYLASLTLESIAGRWTLGVCMMLEKRIYWQSDFRGSPTHYEPDIVLLQREIPEAVTQGLIGGPLKAIIQHDVLDRFELLIGDIIMKYDDVRINIVTGTMITTRRHAT